MIEMMKKKAGRPAGSKNVNKTITLSLDRHTADLIKQHKERLSKVCKFQLTDEQAIQYILTSALEGDKWP